MVEPRKRAPRRRVAAETVPQAAVEPPTVPARPDDPPIFREVWNELYGLPAAREGQVMPGTR